MAFGIVPRPTRAFRFVQLRLGPLTDRELDRLLTTPSKPNLLQCSNKIGRLDFAHEGHLGLGAKPI